MLADRSRRHDPRDRRQLPAFAAVKKLRSDVMLSSCQFSRTCRSTAADSRSRRLRVLRARLAGDRGVVPQSGSRALNDVVAPAHVALVQEVRDVGPRVVGDRVLRLPLKSGGRSGGPARRRSSSGRPSPCTCRPAADHEQVRGQAPRGVRLEHVVLQDEVARVGPVVRDLARVVVAHDVACRRRRRRRPGRSDRCSRASRATASRTKPSIEPPSMSRVAFFSACGPPVFRSRASWNGLTQPPRGSGTQTPRGIPSAPGYVPK